MGEDLLELGPEQGQLVLEVGGSFEDGVEGVDLVLAFVALERVRTRADGFACDGDLVDVACRAHHVDLFERGAVRYTALAAKHNHALCPGALELC